MCHDDFALTAVAGINTYTSDSMENHSTLWETAVKKFVNISKDYEKKLPFTVPFSSKEQILVKPFDKAKCDET